MTCQQHEEWLSTHRGYFPGLETWLKTLPDDERKSVVAVWRTYLSSLTVDAAKAASLQLYEMEKPPHFGDHPKHVLRIGKSIERSQREHRTKNRVAAGIRHCMLCQDSGCASMFAVVSMCPNGRRVLLEGDYVVSHVSQYGFHYRPNPAERRMTDGTIEHGSETLACVGAACCCDAGARLKNFPRLNDGRIAFPFLGPDEKFWNEMRTKFTPF